MAKKYLDISGLTYFWGKISTALGGKQDSLVSGTNIKTVNNQSLLGSGNITVGGGGGGGLTFDDIYPVGSIYMSVGSTSPATLFGGTWVQIEDTFLLASGTNYANGATGGEASHTLTASESGLPAHTHGFTQPSVALGSHSHYAVDADTDRWFVEAVNESVANTTVASSTSGNRRVYGLSASSGNPFTRSKTTGPTELGSKTATGGAVGAVTGGAKNATSAHNNMPPYLAVNVWKRTA